jgi:hypothetical protein
MENLCGAGFEARIRAAIESKIRVRNIALEDCHIADQVGLGDFYALFRNSYTPRELFSERQADSRKKKMRHKDPFFHHRD